MQSSDMAFGRQMESLEQSPRMHLRKNARMLGSSLCKCYSSEGKGVPNASVTSLKGTLSWQLGAEEYYKDTAQQTSQEIDWGEHKRVRSSKGYI